MLVIQAVTYYKRSGEFRVRYRDTVSGKPTVYYSNRLQEPELIFCQTAQRRHEGPGLVCWA